MSKNLWGVPHHAIVEPGRIISREPHVRALPEGETKSVKRADILAAARAELGTPYVHQGRLPGVALDCLGLLVVVAKKLGVEVRDQINYSQWPDQNVLIDELGKHMKKIPIDQAKPGDIILMEIAGSAQHLGFLTNSDPMTIIHSYAGAPLEKVVEQAVTAAWRRRIHSAWQIPGIED